MVPWKTGRDRDGRGKGGVVALGLETRAVQRQAEGRAQKFLGDPCCHKVLGGL